MEDDECGGKGMGLMPQDVSDVIHYVLSTPPHVNVRRNVKCVLFT